MLIELRVENHRSIRDEQVLTMQAGAGEDPADPRTRQVSGFKDRLLPAAALYGANASGKSNVLSALAFMRDAVVESARAWAPDEGVPRDPFAWGAQNFSPSLFEVLILIDGVRYQYGFVADEERFVEEWLYAWPGSRKQTWFVREGDRFQFGEHLGGENQVTADVTRSNALFLSTAVQLRNPQLSALFQWFRRVRKIGINRVKSTARHFAIHDDLLSMRTLEVLSHASSQLQLFPEHDQATGRRDGFIGLLQAADIGIVDVRLESPGDDDLASRGPLRRRSPAVLIRHRSDNEDAWLPIEEESQGTRTLFRMGLSLLDVLAEGSLLLIDELEASLHPALALEIVRRFNDPRTNPKHAQILFTTHDTHLLGSLAGTPALRRDQVWLTEKDPEGATCLYPLSDYKPRPDENLERGYLQGRYGAIPFLGELVRSTPSSPAPEADAQGPDADGQ